MFPRLSVPTHLTRFNSQIWLISNCLSSDDVLKLVVVGVFGLLGPSSLIIKYYIHTDAGIGL